MQRLISESRLQETLALIPMEERTFRKAVETAEEAETVLTIPNNPTNGDVIMAVLDITNIWTGYYAPAKQNQVHIKMVGSENVTSFDADWWNSEYRRVEDGNEHI